MVKTMGKIVKFIFRAGNETTSEVRVTPSLYTNNTSYYGKDGNGKIEDLIGDPDGEPFVVQISGAGWIPLSALVFASSEADAKERVMAYLHRARAAFMEAEEHNRGDRQHYQYKAKVEQAGRVIELATRSIKVERFDKRYTTKASWGGDSFL